MDKEKNFSTYERCLIKYLGEETTGSLIESLGGNDKVMDAVFGSNTDSGFAYDGSFVDASLELTKLAIKLNEAYPESFRANNDSIAKVGMLCNIAKVIMFEPNDNSWEVTNRGMIYKFTDLKGALRTGERSTMLSMNAGVKFTEEEYEAMRIIDKSVDDDNYLKCFSSPLAMVIKQANEILIASKKIKK